MNGTAPEHCSSLEDIRAEIDAIDRAMIDLLGRRFGYVKAAAAFKTDAQSVSAPDRVRTMMAQRRAWAEDVGLDPDVVEQMFRDLVAYFTRAETAHWQACADARETADR